MLPADRLSSHPQLSHELYTLGATVEYLIGNIDQSVAYSKPVLEDADFTREEKFPLRVLECKRLSVVEAKHKEAVNFCLNLLKDMGYEFLWSRSLVAAQAITALSKTTKALQAKPKDFYTELGRQTGKIP